MLRRTLLLAPFALRRLCQGQAPPDESQYEFVSGTVTELSAGRIVVNRAILGKSPEHRAFVMNADTKVEGELKVHARVTVGYRVSEEGEQVAVRIIVRAPATKPKK